MNRIGIFGCSFDPVPTVTCLSHWRRWKTRDWDGNAPLCPSQCRAATHEGYSKL